MASGPHASQPSSSGGADALFPYETRILVGLAGSLGLLLLLVHLPTVTSLTPPTWHEQRPGERIALTALRSQENGGSDATSAASPPPVPFGSGPRTQRDSTGEGRAGSGADDAGDTSSSSSDRSFSSVTTLGRDASRPEMVGGRSALYLHIEYPMKARKQGIEGLLLLGFQVTEEGEAENIRVLRSLHPLCDSAAVRALRSVEFTPARRAGTPVATRTTLPVRFRLVSDSARTRTADAFPNGPQP